MTKLPPAPTYFHKPITALNAHGADVVRPEGCKWLNYEGEIAIVIGRTCRNVAPADAGDYIAGYTVANDYGLHDFRDTDAGSMLRVKGSDTLCPVGPGARHRLGLPRQAHPHARQRRGRARTATTDEMEWDMHYLVADIARTITLVPGDLLLSGTPANCRPVEPGDVVTVEVEGLGALDQPHRQRPDADPHRRRRPAERVGGGAARRRWAATGSSAARARPRAPAPSTTSRRWTSDEPSATDRRRRRRGRRRQRRSLHRRRARGVAGDVREPLAARLVRGQLADVARGDADDRRRRRRPPRSIAFRRVGRSRPGAAGPSTSTASPT